MKKNNFYSKKKVLVTGGSGFIGSHVVNLLNQKGANVIVADIKEYSGSDVHSVIKADLMNLGDCINAVRGCDYIFHLAAYGWGIGENIKKQAHMLTNNLLINTNILEAAYREGIDRFLLTSSSSVYPSDISELDDEVPWSGNPHKSEFYFGWAKRVAEMQAKAYAENYKMQVAIVRPSNPYGPRDTFDLKKSHVIPALILKAAQKNKQFKIWGNGSVIRSFIYVEDLVQGMLLALEKYAVGDPVNLASSEVTSIRDLARMVLNLMGRKKEKIHFDLTKPEGHPRKIPKVKKAREKIGFSAKTSLKEGLTRTIEWSKKYVLEK